MSFSPNQGWYRIAGSISEINFSADGLAEVEVFGKKICLGLYRNDVFACVQRCPHAGGILADGYIDAIGNIVCPLHRYKYNLQNGRNVSGEGYFLKTFPVEVRDDGVFISIANSNGFGI
jgi:nitrite reductase/ring-hydroxylating ferredoxin subunit